MGYQRLGAFINSTSALVSFGLRGMWRFDQRGDGVWQ
jgi:hypothetical protein